MTNVVEKRTSVNFTNESTNTYTQSFQFSLRPLVSEQSDSDYPLFSRHPVHDSLSRPR